MRRRAVVAGICRGLAAIGRHRRPWSVSEEGNGCAERFIHTLKENLLWLKTFWTIEELKQALHAFKDRYNRFWLIECHGQRSVEPVQARGGGRNPGGRISCKSISIALGRYSGQEA